MRLQCGQQWQLFSNLQREESLGEAVLWPFVGGLSSQAFDLPGSPAGPHRSGRHSAGIVAPHTEPFVGVSVQAPAPESP